MIQMWLLHVASSGFLQMTFAWGQGALGAAQWVPRGHSEGAQGSGAGARGFRCPSCGSFMWLLQASFRPRSRGVHAQGGVFACLCEPAWVRGCSEVAQGVFLQMCLRGLSDVAPSGVADSGVLHSDVPQGSSSGPVMCLRSPSGVVPSDVPHSDVPHSDVPQGAPSDDVAP